MSVTRQMAYFVRISTGDKNIIMHPVACLLDRGGGLTLISKDILTTHYLPEMLKPTKPLYSASKRPLKLLEQTTLYIIIENGYKIPIFSVLDNLATDVLLCTKSTKDYILTILPGEQRVSVRQSTFVATLAQQKIPANVVLTGQGSKKVTRKSVFRTGKDTQQYSIQFIIVLVARQQMLEHQSVTSVMVTTKAQSILHLDHDYELGTEGCLTTKGVVEVLQNRPFYILATNIF